MRRIACALGLVLMAFAALGAESPPGSPSSASPAPGSPATAAPSSAAQNIPPNDPAVQARIPACAVWTDRCVTCQIADGKVSCSNIGIACQPQAVVCLRPEAGDGKR
jgi:hypothetical protein